MPAPVPRPRCPNGEPDDRPDITRWSTPAAACTALVLAFMCRLAGITAVAQQAPQQRRSRRRAGGLQLNDREYFETRGLNVLVFTNQYNGMFFDEKTAGIEIIQHGVRLATGGAVRLSPTPEQWDQIPKVVDRKVDKATNTITCVLRYEAFDFDSRLIVTPEGAGFRVAVYLDKPVPEKLEGRAGLNLEFLPSRFFERTYLADGKPGIFPRYPIGPTKTKSAETKIRQFEGYNTFDDRGRNEYVEAEPVADREDVRPRAGGSRAPRHDQGPLRRPPASRRTQPRPERLVHRPFAAGDEGDGEGGGVAGPPEHHPELDADAGRRLLAGRLSPDAEEGGGRRARHERHGAPDRVALRGDGRRLDGRAAEGERPALGPLPPIQVRHGRLQRRQQARPVLHPVRQAEDRDVPDRPERVRHHLARDRRRLVPGADGPHGGQRGVPRLARPRAHGRCASGAAELPALRRLPDGGVDRARSTSLSSASRGSPSAAGSTPATSTSRAGRTRAR